MAPSSNSTMTLQQNRLRPSVAQRIVPAIPLPYLQKRKQQDAVLPKAREQAATPVPVQVVEAPSPSSSTPPASEVSATILNGSGELESELIEPSIAPTPPETPATPITPDVEEEAGTEAVTEGNSIHEETADSALDTPRSNPSDSQSSMSRSGWQPDAQNFVPQNQQQSYYAPTPQIYGQQPPYNGYTNGGPVNYEYLSSNNPSPAPLHANGYGPPNQYQQGFPLQPNSCYPQQMPNGYPPGGFYPHFHGYVYSGPEPGADNLLRHQMAPNGHTGRSSTSSAPSGLDGRPPSRHRSKHGSQASVNKDRKNGPTPHGQSPTAIVSRGKKGQIEDVDLVVLQPTQPKPQGGARPIAGPNGFGSLSPPVDMLDGLVQHIRSSFNDPTFADYTLVLRYNDGRPPFMKFLGHSLILAQSPTLWSLMKEPAGDRRENEVKSRDLILHTGDQFVTSDGVWLALQRLYGNPLMERHRFQELDLKSGGSISQIAQVNLALSYAASGRLLQMSPVTNRGIELAMGCVDFTTLERLLEFSLDGGLGSEWMERDQGGPLSQPTYGRGVNTLIHSCLAFLVAELPSSQSDFSLREVSDTGRLPLVLGISGVPAASHHSRRSQIKFGDHGGDDDSSAASPLSTISRVLLNLPFHLLKYVFDSNLPGSIEDRSNPSVRQEFMITLVDEREKRRLKVHASNVPNVEREAKPKDWDVVGWEERIEVVEERPILTRRWVGFTTSAPPS